MDAQEAIEVLEKVKQETELRAGYHNFPADHPLWKRIEAVYIVLETAKYFHQELLAESLVEKYEDGDIIAYLDTEFNEVIKLSPEKAEALRIEVTE